MTDRHVETLDKQITALSDALARLGKGTTLAELIKIIRRPGWTTPAEFAFTTTILNEMNAHVRQLEVLEKDLLAAGKLVAEEKLVTGSRM